MTQSGQESPSDIEQLHILVDAISDLGYWSWWVEQLPDVFQIEFGGTQLYFPPETPDSPPQTRIAIQFRQPSSINFISKSVNPGNFEWVQLLHEDKIEPPSCSHGEFSFGNSDLTRSLFEQIAEFKTLHGNRPSIEAISTAPFALIFWCGDIGLMVTAGHFKLLNHSGDIPLSDIREINKRWWEYWRNYWDRKDSHDPLPKDYACEVTIPLRN